MIGILVSVTSLRPAGASSGSAPTNTIAPAVTGTGLVGSALSCSTGTWTGSPFSYSYQWYRGAVPVGTNSSSYTVVTADIGAALSCEVTATNGAGASSPAASNAITGAQAPVNTAAPAISGTAYIGNVLTTTNGTWTGSATITYTYQWKRAGVNIGGATASTYTVQLADDSAAITCVVTATNGIGSASATSNSLTVTRAMLLDRLSAGVSANTGLALSVRRLRAGYTGPLLRLRRSTDNVEQDIGYNASNELDTAGMASFLGAADGYLTKWYDQSGNARDPSEPTAGNQVKFATAGALTVTKNGKPTVAFNGSSTRLGTGTSTNWIYANGSMTCAMVGYGSGGLDTQPVYFGSFTVNNARYNPIQTGKAGFITNIAAYISTTPTGAILNNVNPVSSLVAFDTTLKVLHTTDSGSLFTAYVDGATTPGTAYTRSGTNPMDMFSVGARRPSPTGYAGYFNGGIGDLVIIAPELSAADRNEIKADQANYYGITVV